MTPIIHPEAEIPAELKRLRRIAHAHIQTIAEVDPRLAEDYRNDMTGAMISADVDWAADIVRDVRRETENMGMGVTL